MEVVCGSCGLFLAKTFFELGNERSRVGENSTDHKNCDGCGAEAASVAHDENSELASADKHALSTNGKGNECADY